MPIVDEAFSVLEENETPRDICHKKMSENLRKKIEDLISEAERKGKSNFFLSHIDQYTSEEVEIIFNYKTHVFHGFIHLFVPSLAHRAMVELRSNKVTSSTSSKEISIKIETAKKQNL